MSFEVELVRGAARACSYKGLKTPCLYLQSKGGVVPYLMREYLDKLPKNFGICLNYGDVFNYIDLLDKGNSLKKLLSYEGYNIHIQLRDPLTFQIPKTNDNTCSFDTISGKKKTTLEDYNSSIMKLNPDSFTILNDEVDYTTGKNRSNEATKRSIKWLSQTIQIDIPNISKFCLIPTGNDLKSRIDIAKQISHYNGVDGYQVGGIGTGEYPNDRVNILNGIISELPANTPKLIIGMNNPYEIIQAVKCGIDLVVTNYPYILTETGSASTMESRDCNGVDSLDLTDPIYAKDESPLMTDCDCYACKNHSRCYVHHLLNCKEILGRVLLCIHNTYRMLVFMNSLRDSIMNDTLSDFEKKYQSNL